MTPPAPAAGRALTPRGRPAGVAALALLLAVAVPAGAQVGQARVRVTPLLFAGKHMAFFVADLDGDGRRDILVAHLVREPAPVRRCLSVFLQGPDGFPEVPHQTWVLAPRAAALFLGDLTEASGVEIGFLAPDGAWVHEQEGGLYRSRPRKIVHLPTFFDTPVAEDVAAWSGRIDADGDGLDDLFVPTERGIRLYRQSPKGRFGAFFDLPAAPEHAPGPDLAAALGATPGAPVLAASSACALPCVADIDGDGLPDILFVQGDRLAYYLQGPSGRFPVVPTDTLQVPVLREFARKDRLEISLAQLIDVNRDRRADLVVTKRYGNLGDFGSIESVFYFFLARPPAPGSPHPRRHFDLDAPDQQIRLQGFSTQDPEFGDADGDGKPDLLLSQVTTETFGKIIQLGVLREISLYYYLHLFDPAKGRFAPSSAWSRTVAIPTTRIDGGSAAWPFACIRGDVDGDGRVDYVEISGRRELTAHLGRPVYGLGGEWGFSPDDWFRFELESNPESVKVEDLNGDRRADVVLQFSDRIAVLLSK